MHTTTIHVKTDIQTRDDAKKVAEEFGFSLTALVNALDYLTQEFEHEK